MRLVDMVPVVDGDGHRLVSTVSGLEMEMDRYTWQVLRGMEEKSPAELTRQEERLYDELASRGYMEPGVGEMEPRGTEGLETVSVETTDACNLACSHCYLGEKEGDVLEMDAYRRVIDDARDLGAYAVSFTGGETLIDGDLFRRIEYAREREFKVGMVTNGTLIEREHAERLADLDVESVAVTLNGFREEHEGLYDDGSYGPALRGLKRLIDAGNDVYVNFNLYEGNRDTLSEFEEFCRDLGVRGINVTPVKPVGWGSNVEDEIIEETDLCCGQGGGERVMVKADGRVVPCGFLEDELMGNVYEERFIDIYRGWQER